MAKLPLIPALVSVTESPVPALIPALVCVTDSPTPPLAEELLTVSPVPETVLWLTPSPVSLASLVTCNPVSCVVFETKNAAVPSEVTPMLAVILVVRAAVLSCPAITGIPCVLGHLLDCQDYQPKQAGRHPHRRNFFAKAVASQGWMAAADTTR